jgi:predicted ABC-type ATPase
MTDPVLHLVVGANGSGKSTLVERVIAPVVKLEFINADAIAARLWPGDEERHAYEASDLAAERRAELIATRTSFVTETVFSHPSKLELIAKAQRTGFLVLLRVVVIPEDLAVVRVAERVNVGGHSVPEEKIRSRYRRLWAHVVGAVRMCEEAAIYDNSRAATPFRVVAQFRGGKCIQSGAWPAWIPPELIELRAPSD